jgi:hypothetical protein
MDPFFTMKNVVIVMVHATETCSGGEGDNEIG